MINVIVETRLKPEEGQSIFYKECENCHSLFVLCQEDLNDDMKRNFIWMCEKCAGEFGGY